MALNRIYAEDERNNRARVVPSDTVAGTPLLIEDRPAVALTNRGDVPGASISINGGTPIVLARGGVGLADTEASLAFDGTFLFPVTGATDGDSAQGTVVYITSAGALTLTAQGNTRYGTVDRPIGFHNIAGSLPVRVGG